MIKSNKIRIQVYRLLRQHMTRGEIKKIEVNSQSNQIELFFGMTIMDSIFGTGMNAINAAVKKIEKAIPKYSVTINDKCEAI